MRVATTSKRLQTLEILSWCMKAERKAHNQDFIKVPKWSISSGHMWSGPGLRLPLLSGREQQIQLK